MSVARKELLRIHQLLAARPEPEFAVALDPNISDLELLQTVVRLVKRSNELAEHDINNKKFPPDESLAFSSETRDKLVKDETVLVQAQNQLWQPLDKFDDQLRRDYKCRKQMLLTRLDCTIESFKWKGSNNNEPKGGRAKSMNEQIHATYEKARLAMKDEPQVSMAHLLAARQADCDKLLNGVVSTSRGGDCKIQYGNKCGQGGDMVNLKQVIIPKVPDRGGRTDDIRPPLKEAPGYHRGGGGGGHHRHQGKRDFNKRR